MAAPRISDLPAVVASTAGKIELETLGDETREDKVIEKLVQRAVVNVFNRHFALSELVPLIERFEAGAQAEVGETIAIGRPRAAGRARSRSCAARWAAWTSASRRRAWRAESSSCWRACTSTAG